MTTDDKFEGPHDPPAIAVALKNERTSSDAPVVTATGRGELAEQILQIAFENNVKVREDSDLAQILSEVDVDTPIPLEAFAAVSEILSYLYKAQSPAQTSTDFTDIGTSDDV